MVYLGKGLLSFVLFFVCCLLSFFLQGCSEGPARDDNCPAWFDPLIQDFELNMEELDRIAGCTDTWNVFLGNPCASDVPIPLAKKGAYEHTDREWVLGGLRNGYGVCLEISNNICSHWYFAKWGCEREVSEECSCDSFSVGDSNFEGGVYCQAWTCLRQDVDQHTCWVEDHYAYDNFVATCGPAGDSNLVMTLEKHHEMLAAKLEKDRRRRQQTPTRRRRQTPTRRRRTPTRRRRSYSSSCRRRDYFCPTQTPDPTPTHIELGTGALSSRDLSFSPAYLEDGSCIVSSPVVRDNFHNIVREGEGSTCVQEGWRLTSTVTSRCACRRAREDGRACEAWDCTDDHVSERKSWIMQEEAVVCMEATPSEIPGLGHGAQCGAWHTKVVSAYEGEIGECRACKDLNCSWWACTFYGLPAEVDASDVYQWPRRFGITAAHCLWMVPFYFSILATPLLFTSAFESLFLRLFYSNLLFLIIGVPTNLLLWIICFLRHMREGYHPSYSSEYPRSAVYVRNDWRAPQQPAIGLVIIGLTSWLVTLVVASRGRQSIFELSIFPAAIGVSVTLLICFTTTCGLCGTVTILVIVCGLNIFLWKTYSIQFAERPAPSFAVPTTAIGVPVTCMLTDSKVGGEPAQAAFPGGCDPSSPKRRSCKYGQSCYRRDPLHLQEFAHPGDADYTPDSKVADVPSQTASTGIDLEPDEHAAGIQLRMATDVMPMLPAPVPGAALEGGKTLAQRRSCKYGQSCYRCDPNHLQEFAHPGDPDYTRISL